VARAACSRSWAAASLTSGGGIAVPGGDLLALTGGCGLVLLGSSLLALSLRCGGGRRKEPLWLRWLREREEGGRSQDGEPP
jgi:hypothetical protein